MTQSNGKEKTTGLTQDQFGDFKKTGFFTASGFFSEDELGPVTRETDAIVEREMEKNRQTPDPSKNSWVNQGFSFCSQIHRENESLRRFVAHPRLARATHEILGTDIRLYWDQAVYKHPRVGQSFPWHQDSAYGYPTPPEYITCWVAMDDTDAENGGVWVLPGSHKNGILEHGTDGSDHLVGYRGEEPGELTPLKRGDVLFFSSLILHRTGPNHTDRKRRAYVIQFCDAATIRKEDNLGTRGMPLVFSAGKPQEIKPYN